MAHLGLAASIAALEFKLSPDLRYVDLAVRLVVYERADIGLREVQRSRVFGGRWDYWRRAYAAVPPLDVIDIPVSAHQFAIATGSKPHLLVHAGRGGGKSHAICVWMLLCALEIPHGSGQFFSPSAKKSRVLWKKMLRNLPTAKFLRSAKEGISKQPPFMTFKNGFCLGFETAQADAAGQGEDNDALAFDERQKIKQQAVDDAVLTCRKAGGYRMLQIGTPDIDSDFYEEYERYLEESETCEVATFTSYDNPFSSHAVFENEKKRRDLRSYEQDVLGKWVSSKGAVYWMFARSKHVLKRADMAAIAAADTTAQMLARFETTRHSDFDYAIGVDYPRRAVVAKCYNDGRSGGLHVIDAIELSQDSTPWQLAHEIKRRGYTNAVIFDDVGHGDHEGKSESAIMRSQGFRVVHGRRNPRVKDRVNSVAAKLGTADDHISMRFDAPPRPDGSVRPDHRNVIGDLIRCLERQQRDPRTGAPDKDSDLDHFPDALGYLVWKLWPVRSLDEEERRRLAKERKAA